MASIEENLRVWNEWDWSQRGEEWSIAWGGAANQWQQYLLPRINRFLDCDTIVEIGVGAGRWTEFLKDRCRLLIAVDLSPVCVAICKERFASFPQVRPIVNDGITLPDIGDNSVDFVFSFDSLVHAEPPVLRSYVAEVARILTVNGSAFIHHSNCGTFSEDELPPIEHQHWRSRMTSAALLLSYCEEYGLSCPEQEMVKWAGVEYVAIDCFSTIVNIPHR